ncbi:MAG: hypothetical protein JW891_10620 [Candidatus Lokiarchaeota archaeon]|nr:hypothetical protein [Candidatus Lokiarchaeota archaeon]
MQILGDIQLRRVKIKLYELEDYRWCPKILRVFLSKYLGYLQKKMEIYDPIVPKIVHLLKTTSSNTIIDMCSGSFGEHIYQKLSEIDDSIIVKLTDKFPEPDIIEHINRSNSKLSYESKPLDAMNMPRSLKGLRTMFTAFHHFPPFKARKILQDAVDSNQPIAIFEMSELNMKGFVATLFSPFITMALVRKFAREFKLGWKAYVFTWILPAFQAIVLWDGLVSALRTYSVHQMRKLVDSINGSNYYWEIQRISKSMPVIYLAGYSKNYIRNYPENACRFCGRELSELEAILCNRCKPLFTKKISLVKDSNKEINLRK